MDNGARLVRRMPLDPRALEANGGARVIANGRYQAYRIGPVGWRETLFFVLLSFVDERLESVSFAYAKSTGWQEYSKATQDAEIRRYDCLVAELLGDDSCFHWGDVSTVVDAKSGSVSVVVRYADFPRKDGVSAPVGGP